MNLFAYIDFVLHSSCTSLTSLAETAHATEEKKECRGTDTTSGKETAVIELYLYVSERYYVILFDSPLPAQKDLRLSRAK